MFFNVKFFKLPFLCVVGFLGVSLVVNFFLNPWDFNS